MQKKVSTLLKAIALGKFDRGLYMDRSRFQSSVLAGLTTLLCTTGLLVYTCFVFASIIGR